MKKLVLPLLVFISVVAGAFTHPFQAAALNGAWHITTGTQQQLLIFEDGYYTCTQFDKANKKFILSFGGTYNFEAKELHTTIEFHTANKELVGTAQNSVVSVTGNQLNFAIEGMGNNWSRIDNGESTLAGNWRITGRMQNAQMQAMQRGDRKTLKILSGTRFQWMAINPATKEFFGTGGGTYTFKEGKYTETIEFFSRDSSRVGAVLVFDGAVNNNVWTHKGLTSKGEPLHEEWTKEK